MASFDRVSLSILGFALMSCWPTGACADPQVVGTVAALRGTASALSGGNPTPLAVKSEVHEGETVHTGPDSRIRLALRDGSFLSLGADTDLKLDHLAQGPQSADAATTLTQLSGYVRAVVAPVRSGTPFDIRTPTMVAAVRGTDWIQHFDAGTTEIFVARGRVQTSGTGAYAGDTVTLRAGQGVSFGDQAPHTAVVRWAKSKIDLFVAATRVP